MPLNDKEILKNIRALHNDSWIYAEKYKKVEYIFKL